MGDFLAEKKFYEENGYLHLKNFVEKNYCDKLIFRMREIVFNKCRNSLNKNLFLAGENDHTKDNYFLKSANNISFFFDKGVVSENLLAKKGINPFFALNKVGHALHKKCPVFRKFSRQEKIFRLLKGLSQAKPQLVQSMFIFKQAGFGDEVPPHQDATFLYTKPNSVVGLWLALQDTDEENGCLWVLKKGHKGELKNRFVKRNGQLLFNDERKVCWKRKEFTPLCAKKGDIIALHGLLPHLSEQNRSSQTRFALTLHFIDQKTFYSKENWLDISTT